MDNATNESNVPQDSNSSSRFIEILSKIKSFSLSQPKQQAEAYKRLIDGTMDLALGLRRIQLEYGDNAKVPNPKLSAQIQLILDKASDSLTAKKSYVSAYEQNPNAFSYEKNAPKKHFDQWYEEHGKYTTKTSISTTVSEPEADKTSETEVMLEIADDLSNALLKLVKRIKGKR